VINTENQLTNLLNNLGIDPVILAAVLAVLLIILIIVVIINIVRTDKLYRRYDVFMRGKDAETLEDTIAEIYTGMEKRKEQDMASRDVMRVMTRNLVNSFQKIGIVKYNAFEGMGGESSFALAMLNQEDTGFILNAIHSRTSCYVYLKEVEKGKAKMLISEQEQKALDSAMEQRDKIFSPAE